MSDFADRPFAAGSLIGVRSFRVTPAGLLTGCVHRAEWQPGVNEAVCSRASDSLAQFSFVMQSMAISGAEAAWNLHAVAATMMGRVNLLKRPKLAPRPSPPARPEPVPHQAGTLDCSCGFYAYFDEGHNPHHEPGNVLGIVEGFGVCTVGSRGFRSSKARLRALVGQPDEMVRGNYPDVPVFPTLAAALAEFPLTPVDTPKPRGSITWTMTVDTPPRDRALRMRRERFGLDGRSRRFGAGEPTQ